MIARRRSARSVINADDEALKRRTPGTEYAFVVVRCLGLWRPGSLEERRSIEQIAVSVYFLERMSELPAIAEAKDDFGGPFQYYWVCDKESQKTLVEVWKRELDRQR